MDVLICLPGFNPDAPTLLSIVGPDERVSELSAPMPPDEEGGLETVYGGVPYAVMELDLFASVGEYEITAQQESTIATTSFTVEQPGVGLLRIRQPGSGSPGDSFRIQLAGFSPGEPVTLDVYAEEGTFTYVTSITTSPTDSEGRVEHVLSTSSADPPGVYCFVIRGSEEPGCPTGRVIKLG